MSIREDFDAVLSLAEQFSTGSTPAMIERDAAIGRIVHRIESALPELAALSGIEDLDVKGGGRQANYSPVSWVRVYSRAHAPSATLGAYVVYLFSADGSSVFLSLMFGTSEWRSGAMRPVNNPAELRARAAEARRSLAGFEGTPLVQTGLLTTDLAADSPDVGSESRRRIRNYEDATILARKYARDTLPNESALIEDLGESLILLSAIYGHPVTPASSTSTEAAGRRVGRTQGRVADFATRRAIELYAEAKAIELLRSEWEIRSVGNLRLGYDLECTSAGGVLHVEVKGTQTSGFEVLLTRNEVHHHREHGGHCDAEHALFVLSDIRVVHDPELHCVGGTPRLLRPWTPRHDSLVPTEFVYRLPVSAS